MSPNASPLSIMKQKLSFSTPFLGIPLWVLLLASTAAFIVAACVIMCVCFIYYHRQKSYKPSFSLPKSIACKHYRGVFGSSSLDRGLLSAPSNVSEFEINFDKLSVSGHHELFQPGQFYPKVNIIKKDEFFKGFESSGKLSPVAKDVKREFYFSLKEIEDATNGLAQENVIGSGDNGIVYLGLLPNNRRVAVKKLVCDRMSVTEYVDNGNLHYWLHEFPGLVSPLTWTIRLSIIHGVAKGLAYLHEEVEPKILHGNIKSNNILLDHQWNAKISDFGLVKLLSPEWSHIIMETLGLYQGGWLLNHSQPQAHIVDWFKSMISNGKISYVVDPKLPEIPPSKELKRFILVALRCVDPDVNPRIKMGDVVHMLESNLLLFDEHQIAMEPCEHNHSPQVSTQHD
ncbi:Protein kinase domain [Sesbania bispinosa]|nr:Protein kinase domain [Sesbania bispinosa]